jgi:hypothetical protein
MNIYTVVICAIIRDTQRIQHVSSIRMFHCSQIVSRVCVCVRAWPRARVSVVDGNVSWCR